jgi:hypothetical protein
MTLAPNQEAFAPNPAWISRRMEGRPARPHEPSLDSFLSGLHKGARAFSPHEAGGTPALRISSAQHEGKFLDPPWQRLSNEDNREASVAREVCVVPIHFRCPHCDKLLALGMDKGGTQIHCPLCAQLITVPPRTEVKLPTTTVLSTAEAQNWWLGAPPLDEPPRSPPPVEAPPPQPPTEAEPWWTAAPSEAPPLPPPTAPLPPPPEAIAPPAAPEVAMEVVVPESAEQPVLRRPKRRPLVTLPPLPRSHLLILVGVAVVLIGVNLLLLPWYAWRHSPATSETETNKPTGASERDKAAEPEKKDEQGKGPSASAGSEDEQHQPIAAADGLRPVKARRDTTEEDLRRQVAHFPEVSLERGNDRGEAQHARRLALEAEEQGEPVEVIPHLIMDRPDLAGLPLREGEASRRNAEAAQQLHRASLALRARLFEATRGGERGPGGEPRPDAKKLAAALKTEDRARSTEAIPALQQLLMGEDAGLRRVLVEQLARIDGRRATVALAQRALFDPHPGVRQRAITALAKRPRKDYERLLLDGFGYPWPAVADHAAEALAALELRETVPLLRSLLNQPDPAAPYQKPGRLEPFVREVVRINHLRNCVLCHAPSLSDEDKLRGFVPSPEQPVPPPFSREYYANRRGGFFVRADRTYLQQDFAVLLAVDNPGVWPVAQRYDCLVRERPATAEEVSAARQTSASEPSAYQLALRFALRELEADKP